MWTNLRERHKRLFRQCVEKARTLLNYDLNINPRLRTARSLVIEIQKARKVAQWHESSGVSRLNRDPCVLSNRPPLFTRMWSDRLVIHMTRPPYRSLGVPGGAILGADYFVWASTATFNTVFHHRFPCIKWTAAYLTTRHIWTLGREFEGFTHRAVVFHLKRRGS